MSPTPGNVLSFLIQKRRKATYVPLTEQDYAVRRDPRYRAGIYLGRDYWGRGWLTLAVLLAVGEPIGVGVSWWQHDFGLVRARAIVTEFVMWMVCVAALYCYWFWRQQDRAESERGYSFYVLKHEENAEAAELKAVVMSPVSSEEERQRAIDELVSMGLCSLPGQPGPPRRLIF